MISFNHSNYDLTFKYQAGNKTLETIEYKKNTDPSVDKATSVAIENIFINSEPAKDFDWRGKLIQKDHLISCVITEGKIDLRLKIEVIVVDYQSGYMEEPILIDGSLTVGELRKQLPKMPSKQEITLKDLYKRRIADTRRIQEIVNKKLNIYEHFIEAKKTSSGDLQLGTIRLLNISRMKKITITNEHFKEGLNIHTYCNNAYCELWGRVIYVHEGMTKFSKFILEDEVDCPGCHTKSRKPIIDLIFYRCIFEIKGKATHHDNVIEISGEVSSENEALSCEEEPRTRFEWEYLSINTTPLKEKNVSENSSLISKYCNIL